RGGVRELDGVLVTAHAGRVTRTLRERQRADAATGLRWRASAATVDSREDTMRTTASTALALLLAASAATAAGNRGEGRHPTLQQLPDPVRTTLQRESEGAKLGAIERESAHGQKFYEAEIVRNGVKSYVHVGDDGSVLKHESAAEERRGEPHE